MDIQPPASIAISSLPRQHVTTRHDQHSIRREQRLEPQTVRHRLPGPNREVQLAREQLIERLHVALVSHLESQGRVRLNRAKVPSDYNLPEWQPWESKNSSARTGLRFSARRKPTGRKTLSLIHISEP